jgi:hypothetical protein
LYTEVLHDLTAVLKLFAAKGEAAKINITEPPSNDEFLVQNRRKRKPRDDADKRVKNPEAATTVVNDRHLQSKEEFPLMSTEVEADHGNDSNDST